MNKNAYLLLYTCIILCGFLLRVVDLAAMPPGLHFDEARNLIRTWRVAAGYGLPLVFDDIPEPFDAIGRGTFTRFVGTTPFTARLFSAFLHTVAIAAVIGVTRRLAARSEAVHAAAAASGIAFMSIPASVVVGRAIYRANWLPATSMLAAFFLLCGWQTRRYHFFALAGICTALTGMFYIGGLAMFPAMVGTIGVLALRWPRPEVRTQLMVMAGATLATFGPWLYLFVRVPEWLVVRADDVNNTDQLLADPLGYIDHAWLAFRPIYEPDLFFAPQYNTFADPFLNPVLLLLFVIGCCFAVITVRQQIFIVALLLLGVLSLPAALTVTPAEPIRLVATFGPMAVLVGVGVTAITHWRRWSRGSVFAAVILLFAFSAADTYRAFRYHFYEQPRWITDDIGVNTIDYIYFSRLTDTANVLAAWDGPVYFPVNYLNYPNMAALLRPRAFPTVEAYDGRPLPVGDVFVPLAGRLDGTYGSPYVDYTTQYVVMFPTTNTMWLLPPTIDIQTTFDLETRARRSGRPILNESGQILGYTLQVDEQNNPFATTRLLDAVPQVPVATFDENLTLLQIDAPTVIAPDTWIPVTLHWQLGHATRTDYFVHLELLDPNAFDRKARQDNNFAGIHRRFYPTSMWTAGDVVTELRWLYVFADAPSGGYRYGIEVLKHPGPTSMDFTYAYGNYRFEDKLLVGRTAIPIEPYAPPSAAATMVDGVFAESLRVSAVELSTPLEDVSAGATVTVTVHWQVESAPLEDYVVFVHLVDANEQLVAQDDRRPYDGQLPTITWHLEQQVRTRNTLTIPDGVLDGPLHLRIGLYTYPEVQNIPVVFGNSDAAPYMTVAPE